MSSEIPQAHRVRILTSNKISSNHQLNEEKSTNVNFSRTGVQSSVVAFVDVGVHVPVPASEHHPEPGGGVKVGQHPVMRRVLLGSNSIESPIIIQMTNLVPHQKKF